MDGTANSVSAGFCINEKSVSRKHITLSVSKVKPGDGVCFLSSREHEQSLILTVFGQHPLGAGTH